MHRIGDAKEDVSRFEDGFYIPASRSLL